MNRRDFLSSSVVLLLIPVVSGCGNDTTPSNGCDGVFSTSSVTDGHTHTLCVPTTDLTNPPAAGNTYTTSINAGHSHTVMLTQQQLQTINSGGQVMVTSSAPAAHDFVIKKA